MVINLDKLKKDISIEINNEEFYKDILYSDFSVIYYGEKLAKIFYKILKLKTLSECEKNHSLMIKSILKNNLKPIEKTFFNEANKFIKRKNKDEIKYLMNIAEYFTCLRYKALKYYIEDLETLNKIDVILKDEENHVQNKKIVGEKFLNYFLGYENNHTYNKYKIELNISYIDFKKCMYNSNFCKKIRGQMID